MLRQGVATGEPSAPRPAGPGLPGERQLARRRRVAGPLVAQGHIRFAGRLGLALAEIGDTRPRRGGAAAGRRLRGAHRGQRPRDPAPRRRPARRGGAGARTRRRRRRPLRRGEPGGAAPGGGRPPRRRSTPPNGTCDDRRPETLVALAEVRAQQHRADEAERLHRRAVQLGARARTPHTAGSCSRSGGTGRGRSASSGRPSGAAEPGWAYTLGRSCSTTGDPTRPGGTCSWPPTPGTAPRPSADRAGRRPGRRLTSDRQAVRAGSGPQGILVPAGPLASPHGGRPPRARGHVLHDVEAVVLVGGKGTRLRPLTLSAPKPMLPTAGVPFLAHLLSRIRAAGVRRVVLGTSYLRRDVRRATSATAPSSGWSSSTWSRTSRWAPAAASATSPST